jgi:cytochrome o ubiquinol oxidase subunit 2
MKTSYRIALFILISSIIIGLFVWLAHRGTFDVMQAKGLVAQEEGNLIIFTIALMLIVAIPVFGLAIFFAWRYRASNTKAVYMPNWEQSKMDELIWWAIPFEIILVLGALTWISTHELDPHRPLSIDGPALHVQVVALNWKWLFIYPEYGIGSVNEVEFPVSKQVNFSITADAPMNSFWIPQLGGQIYAMTGMVTSLHLVADQIGSYNGVSANYSGEGFARMKFQAMAVSEKDFDEWVKNVKQSPYLLNADTYPALSAPSLSKVVYYGSVDKDMFDSIVMKFMPATTQGMKM